MTKLWYLQPMACHRAEPERLLLRDDASRWYLWSGELHGEPERIPERLARYVVERPEMERLMQPRMWFSVDDLPTRETAISEPDQDMCELGGSW